MKKVQHRRDSGVPEEEETSKRSPRKILVRKTTATRTESSKRLKKGGGGDDTNKRTLSDEPRRTSDDSMSISPTSPRATGRISPLDLASSPPPQIISSSGGDTWQLPIPVSLIEGADSSKKRQKPSSIVTELNELRWRLFNLEKRELLRTEREKFFHVQIDDIQWLGVAGKGGGGCEVWKCKVGGFNCAAKVLTPSLSVPDTVRLFENELAILSTLAYHKNILRYRFYAEFANKRCIFFSYYDDTLGEFLKMLRTAFDILWNVPELTPADVAKHPLSENDLLRIALNIAQGIAFLHANNIIHRDLKSGNVFLTYSRSSSCVARSMLIDKRFETDWIQEVVVADFDVSVRYDASNSPRDFTGTPGYIAPETDSGSESSFTSAATSASNGKKRDCDHKMDVFSFGMILYELLTLREPYYDDRWGAVKQRKISQGEGPVLHPSIENRYPKVVSLHRQCTHVNPAKRPDINEACGIIQTHIATP